jgi:transcriptional regulator with GAF, ATPase, and Fis domain
MNIVEQAVILSQGNTLDFSYWNPLRSPTNNKKSHQEFPSLEAIQRQHILDALEKTHWRVTGPQGAARLLGMKGQTLFSKMKKLGIKRE